MGSWVRPVWIEPPAVYFPYCDFLLTLEKYSTAIWMIVGLRCQDVSEQCYDAWLHLLPLRQAQKLNYEANVSFEEIFI